MHAIRRRFLALALAATSLAAVGQARAQTDDECVAANNKAVALRRDGKLLDARKELMACAAPSCPDVVKSSCEPRLAELNRTVPRVVFQVTDGNGKDLGDVRLTVDKTLYAEKLGGAAVLLDPGDHEFRFEVAGMAPFVTRFVLRESERDRREAIVMAKAPTAQPIPVAPPPDRGAVPAPPPPATPVEVSSGGASTVKTVGLVVGGAGVASLVVGTVFGVLALSAKSAYQQHCGSNIGAPAGACDATGVSGQADAASKATLSTVFLVGGTVAAAAGITLFLIAPKGGDGPQVGIGPSGAFAWGRF